MIGETTLTTVSRDLSPEQSWAGLTIMFRALHRRAYRTARGSP
jgi:hypothetical protein